MPNATHFDSVAGAILDGDVVPVLGAGANLCDRASITEKWQRGKTLPNGTELAELLADTFTIRKHTGDLLRVSSAAVLNRGEDSVSRELHRLFASDVPGNAYTPTTLHDFLATLPKLQRSAPAVRRRQAANRPDPSPQLIVSTNYDDLLEQAFTKEGEPFDLVYYLAQGTAGGKDQGRFVHVPHGERPKVIKTPKSYLEVTPTRRTVILKIHGTVRPSVVPEDRPLTDAEKVTPDSWVISEDHYIDYLTRTNLSQLFPAPLLAKLLKGNLLFLGYAMNDWNLRVILHRICAARNSKVPAWAIQLEADDLDEKLWEERNVDIHTMPLKDYFKQLDKSLRAMVAS